MSVVSFYVSVYVCNVANTSREMLYRYKTVTVRVLKCCRVHTKLLYIILRLSISISSMPVCSLHVCLTEGEGYYAKV